ncbi:MAG TPA: DnaJ domain-containing protein [Fimbriimonas sp.]
MPPTHYETLGVKPNATSQEIRSAYRKLVLKHHPDRSSDPASKAIFLRATEAYGVLNDDERRKLYDQELQIAAQRRKAAQAPPSAKRTTTQRQPPPRVSPLSVELSRLTLLYNRGQYSEAEKVAHQILRQDPRQAMPYAVLGDLARSRKNLDEAQRMYAYAAQMDPRNPVYQRRYEQLLSSTHINATGKKAKLEADHPVPTMPALAAGITIAGSMYLAMSSEASVLGAFGLVASWTLGLLVLLFLCGVITGACLSIGNYLDRFEAATTTATGRSGPTVVLGLVAIVNFWAAALIYILIGLVQRAFNYSTTRLVGSTALVVVILAAGASMDDAIDPMQVLLWGGNLTYLGALVGWLVADAFRGG